MANRQIPARDGDALKKACAELVNGTRIGGVRKAAELLQLSPGRISESMSEFHPERWFSLLHVAELEVLAEDPGVARVLADLSGFELVPREQPKDSTDALHLVSRMVAEMNDVVTVSVAAMADGRFSEAECRAIIAEIDQAVEVLKRSRAMFLPVRRGRR